MRSLREVNCGSSSDMGVAITGATMESSDKKEKESSLMILNCLRE
jgi:hypothetical protein